MDFIFRMFENDKEVTFDYCSSKELTAITDTIYDMFKIERIEEPQIVFVGDDDEKIMIRGIDYDKMTHLLGKKIPVILPQYGLHKWGNVDFLFEF